MYGEWLALHRVLAGKLCYTFILYTCLEPLLNCPCCSSSGVSGIHLKRILFFELGLAVLKLTPKKYRNKKIKIKNIKNVKRCRDGVPKSMQTR